MSLFCSLELTKQVRKSCLAANSGILKRGTIENSATSCNSQENLLSMSKAFPTFKNIEETSSVMMRQDFLHFLL